MRQACRFLRNHGRFLFQIVCSLQYSSMCNLAHLLREKHSGEHGPLSIVFIYLDKTFNRVAHAPLINITRTSYSIGILILDLTALPQSKLQGSKGDRCIRTAPYPCYRHSIQAIWLVTVRCSFGTFCSLLPTSLLINSWSQGSSPMKPIQPLSVCS